ncbi:hypothetical protein QRC94_003776 [Vibrio vulnificus]|uniref:hypothetical protein n=1 Tax=Vibrio vulnificus TaxID=672 RepID=UPI0029408159|nr:hypothetical protein [Vibrio vulnificus]ELR8547956.1 hypothetical protein [Vibrio vulnificus]ELR8552710.1 hypothetical protein [Vibrio vulnificus]
MAVPNAKGNVDLLRQAHKKNVALGERAVASDFIVRILEYPEISALIRTSQLPEEKRGEPVEDFGQYGQGFRQYGATKRDGDIACQIVEIKRGDVIKTISKIVDNKEYVTIEIVLHGEDIEEKGYRLEDAMIAADPSDLDVENRTGTVRVPVNFLYNWFERIGGYAG